MPLDVRTPAGLPRAERSEQETFGDLYARYYRPVLAYARRRAYDRASADDAVAEAFTVLWRRRSDAPTGEDVLPWLYGVARRVLANQRRGRLRRERLLERLRETAEPSAGELALERVEAEAVLRALARMSSGDREILLLAAWEGLGNREIGIALGCSENAAAIRLHRARTKLQATAATESARRFDPREEGRP